MALALHPTLDLTLGFLEIWHCPVLACLSPIHPLWGLVGSMVSKPGETLPRHHIARASFMGHFRFSFSLFVWFFYRDGARCPTADGRRWGVFIVYPESSFCFVVYLRVLRRCRCCYRRFCLVPVGRTFVALSSLRCVIWIWGRGRGRKELQYA